MKIVQINSVYGYGSTGKIVKDIHHQLISQNFESYVFYGRGKKSTESSVFKFVGLIGNILDLLYTKLFSKHGLTNKIATRRLLKKLDSISPDIIHLHNIHGYYINYPMLMNYCQKKTIKVVWLLHDQWVISGSSAYFDEDINWEDITLDEVRQYQKKYPKSIFTNFAIVKKNYELKKHLLTNKDITFVTPSKWLMDVLKSSYLANERIEVIYNGINTEIFKPRKNSSKDSDKITILGVANIWNKRKGLHHFNKLADDLPSNFEIKIIGKMHSQEESIHPRINYIERTDSSEKLAELYSNADVFVNTSNIDNFPTTIIEAQACGTPVITFDTGGSSESIIDSTGYVISKDNYDELLSLLKKIPKKNYDTEFACRENSMKYDRDVMISNYIKLYEEERHKNEKNNNI
ncbi:glycosyltransferase [Streptococcus sp. ZJ151]|uniref:glycosyltransferase n=1 Tax=Streptococcus jiangjianxini TaxID=3161189 RepID=UPI0032F032D1